MGERAGEGGFFFHRHHGVTGVYAKTRKALMQDRLKKLAGPVRLNRVGV